MTCNCRHCGNLICYSEESAGRDVQCSRCNGSIRLPGKLDTIASIRRVRRNSPPGVAMEIGGFLLMFFFFPWGFLAGLVLLYFGWRKSTTLSCSQCGSPIVSRDTAQCPGCRARFASE